MKIGVLDIQGSVEEHVKALEGLGVDVVLVKRPEQLEGVSGLIMPGGESTTIGKLLARFGLDEEIKRRVGEGMALYGSCAGAILLAKRIAGRQMAKSLELMDVVIERNAYGRQMDSFETELEFDFGDKVRSIEAVFIRAPRIVEVGEGVNVLARHSDEIVAAREGKILVTGFHPELTEDLSVHEYFLGMCGED